MSYWSPETYSRKSAKINNNPTKHHPNKDEARQLRQLKANTGLSEEEIREHHEYRVMLSNAQKMGQKAKRTFEIKFACSIIRKACQITKLPKEHPDTIKEIDRILGEVKTVKWYYPNSHVDFSNSTGDSLLKKYGKHYK